MPSFVFFLYTPLADGGRMFISAGTSLVVLLFACSLMFFSPSRNFPVWHFLFILFCFSAVWRQCMRALPQTLPPFYWLELNRPDPPFPLRLGPPPFCFFPRGEVAGCELVFPAARSF